MVTKKIELFNKGFLVNDRTYIFYDKIECFELSAFDTFYAEEGNVRYGEFPECTSYQLEIETSNSSKYRFSPISKHNNYHWVKCANIEELQNLNLQILNLYEKIISLIKN